MPLLERIHRGQRHVGKVPPHAPKHEGPAGGIAWNCGNNSRQAVEHEAYEEAAQLRDLIRQKEPADEPG